MPVYFAILPIINVFLCGALSLFTLSRNPRHPVNIGFAIGLADLAVMEAGSVLVLLSSYPQETALWGIRLVLTGQIFLPPAWLLFSLVFAKSSYKEILSRWTPVLIGMGLISTFFSLQAGSPDFISYSPDQSISQATFFIIGPTGRYFYVYFLAGLVINLVHLENTLRSSKGTERWQIKYVVFGVGAILFFFIYHSSQVLLFSLFDIKALPATSFIILVSTAMMALFIVRHRLLHVDVFVSRYVAYNSFTMLAVGLYLFAVGIIAEGVKYLGIPYTGLFSLLFVFLSALALIILFFSTTLRRKAQLFINRNFYKHKYEFRDKWMETIEKISFAESVEETQNALIGMISETMRAKGVSLWLYDPSSQKYCLRKNGKSEDEQKSIGESHAIIRSIKEKMSPFLFADMKSGELESTVNNEEMEELAAATGAVMCSPLAAGQDIVGFILQGEDISGEPYGKDDFEFLKAITTQATVQIKKIRLSRELMIAKEVEAFHKISSFIIHDLKNHTNSLSLISQNAKDNLENPEFQRDVIKTIDHTVSQMKRVIDKLSSVRKTLELKKMRASLFDLINHALKKMPLKEIKNVVATNETEGIPPLLIDPDAIEMVFLNLLANAYDSINRKGIIKVKATLDVDHVNITVSDDGAGIPKKFMEGSLFQPFKTTKKNGFGIGLYQCKTIIEAHGGMIEVESEEGKGTVFSVRLPV